MSIFNSLGSNYSAKFVWQSLLAGRQKDSTAQLTEMLGQHYGGKATLTYKGREALEIALKNSGLPADSVIGVNGFTCYAVYRAVQNTGYKALPVDIAPGQLNFGLNELKHNHNKHPELKAVIVQNTLGYPADMVNLAAYCQQAGLLLIEDLAHSTGLVYASGQEAGTVGALTMMSFSQDKPLDVVAGGALIDRRPNAAKSTEDVADVSKTQALKNRFYPLFTSVIRGTYAIGLGRYVHFVLKKLNLMATPMSDDLDGLHKMTEVTAGLLIKRWPDLAAELTHRREIAAIYTQQLTADLQAVTVTTSPPTYLRFPILVKNRESLVDYLKKQKIFIGDTWYDAPIGPKKYITLTNYTTGMCPNAEELASHIVNLPTHRHVTPEIAQAICAKIKQWQALAPKS